MRNKIDRDKNINIIHHYYNSQFIVEYSSSTTRLTFPNQNQTHIQPIFLHSQVEPFLTLSTNINQRVFILRIIPSNRFNICASSLHTFFPHTLHTSIQVPETQIHFSRKLKTFNYSNPKKMISKMKMHFHQKSSN